MPISPEILEQARRIEIRVKRLVNTIMAGEHPSIFKGRGYEFHEIREYQIGDDVRNIDWKTTAKLNTPHVRVSIEEKELPVTFIADISGSMDYGSGRITKRYRLVELVTLLGLIAVRKLNPVSVIAFTDRVEFMIKPRKGRQALMDIITRLLSERPPHRGSSIGCGIEMYRGSGIKKGIAFVISDFLSDDYGESLRLSVSGWDIVPVVITDEREGTIPEAGFVHIFDLETGGRTSIDTMDPAFRMHVAARLKEIQRDREALFKSLGIDWIDISTSPRHDNFAPVREFFLKRAG